MAKTTAMIAMFSPLFLLFVLCTSVPAQAEVLAVDLSEDHVDITTGFNGARLSLFGVQDRPGDIAITIEGPQKTMVVRRKENIGGVWMNRAAVTFTDIPGFYDYAISSTRIDKAVVGIESLDFITEENGSLEAKKREEFQGGLIRNKQAQRLFPRKPRKIKFISDNFFKARFRLPPNVPTGPYTISTHLINKGKIVETKTTTLKVEQVGTSAAINRFSRTHAAIYGILCVIFAMSVGWMSNALRNRLR